MRRIIHLGRVVCAYPSTANACADAKAYFKLIHDPASDATISGFALDQKLNWARAKTSLRLYSAPFWPIPIYVVSMAEQIY